MNVNAVHGCWALTGTAVLSIQRVAPLLGKDVLEVVGVGRVTDGGDHVPRVAVSHRDLPPLAHDS